MATRKLTQLIQTTTGIGFTGSRGEIGYTGSAASGVTGYSGSEGAQGITGYTGSEGQQGIQGNVGYTGSEGIQGIQGIQGITGYTGSEGIQGNIGYTGSQGPVGYTGSSAGVGSIIKTITLVQPGTITAPYTGVARYYPVENVLISNVYASLGTVSTSTFSFRVNKNGTTVDTYNISSNANRVGPLAANISLTTGDYLTVDIISSSGATDLKVDLLYQI
jgi:hypothetical protein